MELHQWGSVGLGPSEGLCIKCLGIAPHPHGLGSWIYLGTLNPRTSKLSHAQVE